MYTYNVNTLEIKVIEYPDESIIAYVDFFRHADIKANAALKVAFSYIEMYLSYAYKDVPEEVWENALLDGNKIVRMLARRDEIFPNEYMERYLIVTRNI